MAKYKVVLADTVFPDLDVENRVLGQIDAELILAPSKDEAALCELVKDCDALMTTYTEITKKVIDSMEKCKVIIRYGIGYNNIDIPAASAKGIMVANVLNYCVTEVADHAMALMLSCLRKVTYLNKTVHEGNWNVALARPMERISKLTLGLIGFGNIARQVAVRAKAFGMNIIAYDPFLPEAVFEQVGVEKIENLDDLLAHADVVSPHLQLTGATAGIINENSFKKMKNSAFLINVSRGGLVDEKALLEAIRTKEIAGCALDVMATEPGDVHSPLLTFDNVIITPHSAFCSLSSDVDLRTKAAEEVVQTFTQGYPEFWLNKDMNK